MFIAINPSTGEEIARRTLDSAIELEHKIATVCQQQYAWNALNLEARARALATLAELLEQARTRLARIMTCEMGKPLAQAEAEIAKCILLCQHIAAHGEKALAPKQVPVETGQARLQFEPLGIVFGIMPWNFPFWQVFRFAVPVLFAGNGILIKHAPNVPGCAAAIVELFHAAGIKPFEHLYIDTKMAREVIADRRIAGVSLTGSRSAGAAVAAAAGQHIKKSVLELGGSDPYLVLADADLELAAHTCCAGRLLNSGQTCIAAKRWIVVDTVYEAFREQASQALSDAVVGDPMDAITTVGPMARADLREALHRQVRQSIAAGAKPLLGAEMPDGPGFYYPVSLLENVCPGMPAFDEELFGPVACLIRARDERDAIRLANLSDYGLGAGVFSRDVDRAMIIANQLQAGNVAINDFVKSDPRLPFGGIKQSGYGRELSDFGLREFVNIKTVVVSG